MPEHAHRRRCLLRGKGTWSRRNLRRNVDARREFGKAERRGAGCVRIDGRERNIILKKGDGSGDGAAGRAQNRGQGNRVRPDLIVGRGGKGKGGKGRSLGA